MNTVVLIGRLTSDPKLSYTTNTNTAVASFRLAVARPTKDNETDFIQCRVFGRQAENLERFKVKGDEIAVHGRIETGSYKNRDGNTVYTTDVVCDRVEFTHGSKSGYEPSGSFEPVKEKPQKAVIPEQAAFDDWGSFDDDIPF